METILIFIIILLVMYTYTLTSIVLENLQHAPNLQHLRIVDHILMEYEVHEMQSIQQANLDVQYLESATVDPQRAHNLVEGVAKTPRLILSAGVVLVSFLIIYQNAKYYLPYILLLLICSTFIISVELYI